jgi:hypothetical protein
MKNNYKITLKFAVNNHKVYDKRKRKKKKIKFTSVCMVGVSYAVNLVGSVIPRGK